MKIGILQTGETPLSLRENHGDYDDLYKRLLEGRGFLFETWRVLDGTIPDRADRAQGWLITGSRFAAYENHGWIGPLEEFLRQTYEKGVPIVGVCFGHQILAQALGGRVEKYPGGWSVGAVTYKGEFPDGAATIMAWHQDQVTELPKGARVTASTPFCPYAMLSYGQKALTLQPHPEFTAPFMAGLIEARRDVLPADIARRALENLGASLSTRLIADQFEHFFKLAREN